MKPSHVAIIDNLLGATLQGIEEDEQGNLHIDVGCQGTLVVELEDGQSPNYKMLELET